MHSRTLIRNGIYAELVQAGAWRDAVYVEPLKPIDEYARFPNICIFARDDRTVQKNGNEFLQGLKITIEIRARRENNAALPDNTNRLAADLDGLCEIVENIIGGIYQNGKLTIDSNTLFIDQISEVNTTISPIITGAAPYMLAELEFEIRYRNNYCRKLPDFCEWQKTIGALKPVVCNEPAQGIKANSEYNNPTLGVC